MKSLKKIRGSSDNNIVVVMAGVIVIAVIGWFVAAALKEPQLYIVPVLAILAGISYWIYIVDKEGKEEIQERKDKKRAEEQNRINQIAIRKQEEETETKQKFQKVEKVISKTNDNFNINLEGEFSPEFVQTWVKLVLKDFDIEKMSNDVHGVEYNEATASLLANNCEFILKAIYTEWYRGYYPPKPFEEIEQQAREYANGSSKKLSVLENYIFFITKHLLYSLNCSTKTIEALDANMRNIFGGDGFNITGIFQNIDRRKINNQLLERKILLLATTVFFRDLEGCIIEGRAVDRKKQSEDVATLLRDIDKVKQEIVQSDGVYRRVKEETEDNKQLSGFIKLEIDKLRGGESDFIEQCMLLNEMIDKKLS